MLADLEFELGPPRDARKRWQPPGETLERELADLAFALQEAGIMANAEIGTVVGRLNWWKVRIEVTDPEEVPVIETVVRSFFEDSILSEFLARN